MNLTSHQGLVSGLLLAPIPLNLCEKVIKNHSHIDILTHLIWLFSHIASDSIVFRNMILASNFYKRIIAILQQTVVNSEVMRQGCWLLGNTMRGKPAPSISFVIYFFKQQNININKYFSHFLFLRIKI